MWEERVSTTPTSIQLYSGFRAKGIASFTEAYMRKGMDRRGFEWEREAPSFDCKYEEDAGHLDDNNNHFRNTSIKCVHVLSARFRCISCTDNVCLACLLRFHKTCQFAPEQSYLRQLCLSKAKEFKKILGDRLNELNNLEKNLALECSAIKSTLEERSEALVSSIMSEKRILSGRLSFIKEVKTSRYKRQADQCRDALKQVFRMEEDSSKLKSFSDLNRKVSSLVHHLEKMKYIKDSKISIAQYDSTSLGQIMLSACARYSTLELCGNAVQNVMNSCIITVKNDLGEIITSDDRYRLCVRIVDADDKPVFVLIENLKNGCFHVKFYPLSHGKHTLHASLDCAPILSCPKEIIVSEEPEKLLEPAVVFGREGGRDGEFARPWGVCCDGGGRIFVADRCNHRIQIFSKNGHFLHKFGKEGSDRGELNRPTGIAVDKFERVIVADKDNHRIQIFDIEGTYITHFGYFGRFEDNLSYPWDVAVTKNCQIAVTETKERRVRLFTDTGIELLRFCFTAKMDLELPRGITVLPDGSFLVTDFNKHKIVLLNERFERPRVLGCEGMQPQEFFRPQSVASNGRDMFAVSDCKNYRIQIFKNNIFYKVIGRNGKEPGEVDAPQGIAFHPDGSLVVVDYGNSRLQVFDID